MSLNNLCIQSNNEPSGEGYDITTPYGEVNIGFEHDDCDVYLTVYPFDASDLETRQKCEVYVKDLLEQLPDVKCHVNSVSTNSWRRDNGGTGLIGFYMSPCIYEQVLEMLNGREDVSKSFNRPV